MAQISEPVFLYGFVALIFGPPFFYFAWRMGQRWKQGENLLTGKMYHICLGYSVVIGFHAISNRKWPAAAVALLILVGSSWMRLVEWNDSRA